MGFYIVKVNLEVLVQSHKQTLKAVNQAVHQVTSKALYDTDRTEQISR